MISTNRRRDREVDTPWFLNPERKCWDKEAKKPVPGYDDLDDIVTERNRPRKKQIKALADACYTCPVFRECRIDFLASTKDWEHYGIRSGIVGQR